ncbi:hypothetical protein JS531_04365 [Bifidobacterium sp. CP2]|uniref:hypothetical protein n=1 Tax=Bifidobacterium TaxID=1678 RepID=UPI001BDCC35E|nr:MULTISPECIES: hypothetical protein [Bifidobacterium]MBT1181217.1 hypothetical protein [Bifidobacterium sp. CP2]MBW3079900.1 hypothetical protein [Bifidobacterium saguinibicoloris]
MFDLMPAALWCVAVVLSLNIVGLCVVRGRLGRPYTGEVRRVSWPVVFAHVTSLVVGAMPYILVAAFRADARAYSSDMIDFYDRYGWPSAVFLLVMLVLQWLCLYWQAFRAWKSEELRAARGNAE